MEESPKWKVLKDVLEDIDKENAGNETGIRYRLRARLHVQITSLRVVRFPLTRLHAVAGRWNLLWFASQFIEIPIQLPLWYCDH